MTPENAQDSKIDGKNDPRERPGSQNRAKFDPQDLQKASKNDPREASGSLFGKSWLSGTLFGHLILRKSSQNTVKTMLLCISKKPGYHGTGSAFKERAASMASDRKDERSGKNREKNQSKGPRGA